MKQNRSFTLLGITGGAGSGKSTVVGKIQEMFPTEFLHCDVIAHELMQPGGASYEALLREFGPEILEKQPKTGELISEKPCISRSALAAVAMATPETRKRLNEVTHPLVREEVEKRISALEEKQFRGIVVIEAALLIEAGYKELCDTLWYVRAPKEDRIRRMKEIRGYSEEKIVNILNGQLSEEQFEKHADVIIDNPDMEPEKQMPYLQKQIAFHLKEQLESTGKV